MTTKYWPLAKCLLFIGLLFNSFALDHKKFFLDSHLDFLKYIYIYIFQYFMLFFFFQLPLFSEFERKLVHELFGDLFINNKWDKIQQTHCMNERDCKDADNWWHYRILSHVCRPDFHLYIQSLSRFVRIFLSTALESVTSDMSTTYM